MKLNGILRLKIVKMKISIIKKTKVTEITKKVQMKLKLPGTKLKQNIYNKIDFSQKVSRYKKKLRKLKKG